MKKRSRPLKRYKMRARVVNGHEVKRYHCVYHEHQAWIDAMTDNPDFDIADAPALLDPDAWVFVASCRWCQEELDKRRFGDLDPIKYNYEIAVGYLGRWFSILDRLYYKDEIETIGLIKEFLSETLVSETVFLDSTADLRGSQEYQDWLVKEEASEHVGLGRRKRLDWTWQALQNNQQCYSGDVNQARTIISEVKQTLDREALRVESKRFDTSSLDYEHERSNLLESLFDIDTITVNPPWLLEGIKSRVAAWADNGRGQVFDIFVEKQRAETKAEKEKVRADEESWVDLLFPRMAGRNRVNFHKELGIRES